MSEQEQKDHDKLKRRSYWDRVISVIQSIGIVGLAYIFHATYDTGKKVVNHVNRWDAGADKVDTLGIVVMKLSDENKTLHVIYDKVALKDSTLSGKEHDILRNDENRNIVTR